MCLRFEPLHPRIPYQTHLGFAVLRGREEDPRAVATSVHPHAVEERKVEVGVYPAPVLQALHEFPEKHVPAAVHERATPVALTWRREGERARCTPSDDTSSGTPTNISGHCASWYTGCCRAFGGVALGGGHWYGI